MQLPSSLFSFLLRGGGWRDRKETEILSSFRQKVMLKKKKKGKKSISYHNIWWTSCPPKVMKKENNFIFGELTYWPFNSCWKSVTKYMMISWIQYLIHRLGQYWSKNTTCPSASPKNKMVAEESNLWNAFVFFLFFF